MTEYYDEAYFCIYKDPIIWAQHCGNPIGQMIDLPPILIQPPPLSPIPEPSSVILMVVGVVVLFAVQLWRKYNV